MVIRYYVMRQYSGITAQKVLWQMLSRGIKDKRDAQFELDWHESLSKNPNDEFFLVAKEEER